MVAFLWPLVAWLLREIVIKFVIFSAVFALVIFFVPFAAEFIGPFIGVPALNSAFQQISPGVWFFLDFFHLAFGVPLLISAVIARFLIRRLPVIG